MDIIECDKFITIELEDISVSKKKDTSFHIIHYTMNKKTLKTYPALNEVVESFNKKLKELLLPNLKQTNIYEIYIRSNIAFGHTEYPIHKYEFTMMHNNKKHIIYIKAADLMRLVLKIAKSECVKNIHTQGMVNNSDNIYIQFSEKYNWFWKLMGCCVKENKDKVVTYIGYNLDAEPIKEIYNFSSETITNSAIAVSHCEKVCD
jgi:hypothetical protein